MKTIFPRVITPRRSPDREVYGTETEWVCERNMIAKDGRYVIPRSGISKTAYVRISPLERHLLDMSVWRDGIVHLREGWQRRILTEMRQ